MIFKREPSVWLGIIRAVIALLVGFSVINFTEDQTSAILALSSAVFAVALALSVRPFKWPLITGLFQAALALLIGFGLDLSQEQQGGIMAVVALIVAAIADRPTVTPEASLPATAPTPARG